MEMLSSKQYLILSMEWMLPLKKVELRGETLLKIGRVCDVSLVGIWVKLFIIIEVSALLVFFPGF